MPRSIQCPVQITISHSVMVALLIGQVFDDQTALLCTTHDRVRLDDPCGHDDQASANTTISTSLFIAGLPLWLPNAHREKVYVYIIYPVGIFIVVHDTYHAPEKLLHLLLDQPEAVRRNANR